MYSGHQAYLLGTALHRSVLAGGLTQWDPERDLLLQPQAHRAIQIGLSKQAVDLYVKKWVQHITDVTLLAHNIHALVGQGELESARALLPVEQPYSYEGNV